MANTRTQKERVQANTARFIPGRTPRLVNGKMDDKIFFPSVRYSDEIIVSSQKLLAGIGFGPDQHTPKRQDLGDGFELSAGGLVIPTHANEKFETVPIRDYTFTPDGAKKPVTKRYVDRATFEPGPNGMIRALPCYREDEVYFEVWSGHPEGRTDATNQLIQAGMFLCGSVAYCGARSLLDATSPEAGAKTVEKNINETDGNPDDDRLINSIGDTTIASGATLLKERVGEIVGGVRLWDSRFWRVRFSPKDSEMVLVRHLGKFWMLMGKPDVGHVIEEMPPAAIPRMAKDFTRLTLEQPLKLVEQEQLIAA